MDEDIAIVNQNTRIILIKNFLKKNLKKFYFFFTIIVILLIIFFVFDEIKKRKKEKLAQIYNSLIFNTEKYSQKEITDRMIEIIKGKVDTYSTLALYYLIDNNLINDHDKIDDLFNDVILINKDTELKNLVIFKKGLYFSDKLSENELLEILNPIINSESIWKQHALLLMGDFYFHNKQLNKSKEFFTLITELDNVNPKLKTDIERRLRRDFSE